ncbi:methyltransferase [Gelidibacter salicanalis]|uniref:SAM-dependent methyltransferase n=1 Tax=Gelidibacter salicanalis TaxID=291193 RepID=A0A934KQF0_9FLAO|nr:methyltransferase [Gelidibacter salicanalis]MBJ7879551.1 SAM-dependent methyltransferase [Gelidibacter salicanalis]
MSKKELRAADALLEAQKIAFAPFIFQSSVTLKKLGVFDLIFDRRHNGGVTIDDISEQLSISRYGLGVLLEFSESAGIVSTSENGIYELTKTGYFLNYSKDVNVNLNFTHDICYKGLFHLDEAIKTGEPSGLKELGQWDTIYEGLSQLTPKEQQSWFEFDHFYSDGIFEEALKRVFKNQPKFLFDIGGNTGKFALQCFNYDDNIQVKIIDLPGQLNKALKNIKDAGFANRISGQEIDWLKPNPQIPTGADVIWMSQFLDCFSEDEILLILSTCVASMDAHTELIIIETFTDRQEFPMSKFILEATSLYFTVMANGNSKMYPATVFETLIEKAGLTIEEDLALGEYHTMLVCKKS